MAPFLISPFVYSDNLFISLKKGFKKSRYFTPKLDIKFYNNYSDDIEFFGTLELSY